MFFSRFGKFCTKKNLATTVELVEEIFCALILFDSCELYAPKFNHLGPTKSTERINLLPFRNLLKKDHFQLENGDGGFEATVCEWLNNYHDGEC
jgi:hypothetical protein